MSTTTTAHQHVPTPPHPRTRRGAVLVGAALCCVAVAALVIGAVILNMHRTKSDADGFYSSSRHAFDTDTPALVMTPLEIADKDSVDWLLDNGWLGTVRVTATGHHQPVFVGIARQAEVDRYLRAVERDEVEDLDLDPFGFTADRHDGGSAAARPTEQDFWKASASGSGEQTIRWTVRKGDWALVVMNADGSAGVETNLSFGAKIPLVYWTGAALILLGAALAVGGGLLIVTATSRRRG